MVIALVLPLAFAVRRRPGFRLGVVTVGSLAIVAVALGWLVERAFAVMVFQRPAGVARYCTGATA